jgi:hypothetical protein
MLGADGVSSLHEAGIQTGPENYCSELGRCWSWAACAVNPKAWHVQQVPPGPLQDWVGARQERWGGVGCRAMHFLGFSQSLISSLHVKM